MTKPHHDDAKDHKAHDDHKDHKAHAHKDKEIEKPAPERSYRDQQCVEQGRHRPNCECAGEARKPF